MNEQHSQAAVQRIRQMFEQLQVSDLPRLAEIYSTEARFKDPFNEVQGLPAVQGVFAHMFKALRQPRFVIHDSVVQGQQCFLTWSFLFYQPRLGKAEQCIRGGSHLLLDEEGRIREHRDYWDAAEELYEKFPVLGVLLRWLKRRAAS